MATALHLPDLRAGYLAVCETVLRSGEVVSPRGLKTYELLGVTLEVEDLADTLPLGVGRRLSTEVAALEALQLIGEVSRPELLVAASPRFEQFREPDGSFHGAYGLRVHGQTGRVLERLCRDPSSRQAVVTIWDPALDSHDVYRDLPCTVTLQLLLRGDRLHLQVYMRSNDVWLGLAYDYFVFSQWLWTVASVLGVEPGRYTHHVGSLHLYDRDRERVEDLHVPDRVSPNLVPPRGLDVEELADVHPRAAWESARLRAVGLLDQPGAQAVPGPNDVWYRSRLLEVHRRLEEARRA